ncbi:hypothetical protein FHQ18_00590 [Deferribacter autotrophicus]|uniref:Uncharacterized protein n=1 Tax=Deferribacter autotrophicus TaxID=500465 RepID=A0A5A8F7K6_9BACT|nr:hypothetical protein [Deferribacter autotrophicus]KAA0259409.1 hypothetical protein FHQ18_00590 [Deferribacter autotrophicus]
MIKMFLLTDKEKESFLKAIYSVMMFDRQISDEENEILEILKSEILQIDKFLKIDLEKDELIVDEINKIYKIIPVIYLFNILFELKKYHKKEKRNEYLKRVKSILKNVKMYDEIVKSKLFIYSAKTNEKDEDSNIKEFGLQNKIKKFLDILEK